MESRPYPMPGNGPTVVRWMTTQDWQRRTGVSIDLRPATARSVCERRPMTRPHPPWPTASAVTPLLPCCCWTPFWRRTTRTWGYAGAGPVEDVLVEHGPKVGEAVADRCRQSNHWRQAVAGVWLDDRERAEIPTLHPFLPHEYDPLIKNRPYTRLPL